MNQPMKARLSIDLDALENQLKATYDQPGRARKDDALAELARIVGQEDPFRALLSSERGAREPRMVQPTRDLSRAVAAVPAPVGDDNDRLPARLPQAPEWRAAGEPVQALSTDSRDALTARQPAGPEAVHDHFDADPGEPPIDAVRHGDESAGEDPRDYGPLAARRSRKGLVAVASVLGLAAFGIAGAFAYKATGARAPNGEPPVIKADLAPTKTQPQNPGGAEMPNQNKQIYERVGQASPPHTKVIDRQEQPIDVSQAALRESAPALSGAAAGKATDASSTISALAASPEPPRLGGGMPGLGEPRRVKTVAVKPDGSILADAPASAPLPVARPAPQAAPAPAKPKPAATTPAAAPATPKPAPRVVVQAKTEDASARPSAGPLSITPLAQNHLRPHRVAAAADDAAPVATASTHSAGGDYTVQLGAPGSEKEARDTFASLQRKFPSHLGSHQATIRKADSGGRTIYRVRVGALSREQATSLCSRLQAAGGACFVAKN